MEDRRRYFRIEDEVILNIQPLSREVAQARTQELEAGLQHYVDPNKPLQALETELMAALVKLRGSLPEVAAVVELLDAKFEYLQKYTNLPESERTVPIRERPRTSLSMSACGIAFESSEQYAVGQNLQLSIALLPSYLTLTMVSEVARSRKAPSSGAADYETSVDFTYISEEHQDQLIHHILKKQSEHLHAKRNA